MTKTLIITGSSGLVGSATVRHFTNLGWKVIGIDNNMRRFFFGASGNTDDVRNKLLQECSNFIPLYADVRDALRMYAIFREFKPDAVVHAAGQPSHDWATKNPSIDWDVNANGTFNVLSASRDVCPEAPFVFMSTNKVYGDAPNRMAFSELETRYDYRTVQDRKGISEECTIDQVHHSIFGASKLAADIMVQEFSRTYGMNTVVFRAGCITGKNHAGVALHGFLAYMARALKEGLPYTIYGFGGKQVRDQIHASDMALAFEAYIKNPVKGGVYNIGGGRDNSISLLEAIQAMESMTGKKLNVVKEEPQRAGDHVCYISDIRHWMSHFPSWEPKYTLKDILHDLL